MRTRQSFERTTGLWLTIAIFLLVNVTKSGPWSVKLPFLLREAPSLNVDALDWISGVSAAGQY